MDAGCPKGPILGGFPAGNPAHEATASKLFLRGVSLCEYGSEGFRLRLRRLSEYGSVAHSEERPARETQAEQYSDTTLLLPTPNHRFWLVETHTKQDRQGAHNGIALRCFWLPAQGRADVSTLATFSNVDLGGGLHLRKGNCAFTKAASLLPHGDSVKTLAQGFFVDLFFAAAPLLNIFPIFRAQH